MSGVTYYVSGRAKKLQTLDQIIKRETINGIRRGQQRIRRAAAEGLRLRSIGRTLFGKKASGAYKNLKRGRVEEQGNGIFSADLRVNGIAAIQDQGWAIKPHLIRGRGKLQSPVMRRSAVRVGGRGPLQSFAKGSVVSAYMHPGVKSMPAFPFVNRALESNRGAFKAEIEKAAAKVAALVA